MPRVSTALEKGLGTACRAKTEGGMPPILPSASEGMTTVEEEKEENGPSSLPLLISFPTPFNGTAPIRVVTSRLVAASEVGVDAAATRDDEREEEEEEEEEEDHESANPVMINASAEALSPSRSSARGR